MARRITGLVCPEIYMTSHRSQNSLHAIYAFSVFALTISCRWDKIINAHLQNTDTALSRYWVKIFTGRGHTANGLFCSALFCPNHKRRMQHLTGCAHPLLQWGWTYEGLRYEILTGVMTSFRLICWRDSRSGKTVGIIPCLAESSTLSVQFMQTGRTSWTQYRYLLRRSWIRRNTHYVQLVFTLLCDRLQCRIYRS